MKYLSLFSGVGGGDLGCQHLLSWDCVGYIEWDKYCVKVIEQRIKDGLLSDAPIFHCDIREFNTKYAQAYQGMVDVITAGFPCQPFSVAGKQRGAEDERNMWPATAQVIEIVQPQRVLLENVPGICRYLPVVVRDLRRIGYEVRRPLILGADDVGAPHRRKRVWILAYSKELDGSWSIEKENNRQFCRCKKLRGYSWWQTTPPIYRVDDGVPFAMDRLKAIGNGQVSLCTAIAWRILSRMG